MFHVIPLICPDLPSRERMKSIFIEPSVICLPPLILRHGVVTCHKSSGLFFLFYFIMQLAEWNIFFFLSFSYIFLVFFHPSANEKMKDGGRRPDRVSFLCVSSGESVPNDRCFEFQQSHSSISFAAAAATKAKKNQAACRALLRWIARKLYCGLRRPKNKLIRYIFLATAGRQINSNPRALHFLFVVRWGCYYATFQLGVMKMV